MNSHFSEPFPPTPNYQRLAQPSLEGRTARLRVIQPEDYRFLYWLETNPANAFRWRHRGSTPGPEEAIRTCWQGMLCAYIVESTESSRPEGLAIAFNLDERNRHCHIGVLGRPDREEGGINPALEGIIILVQHLFEVWQFRKLYAEVLEYNYDQFQHATGPIAIEEGRLRDHDWMFGRYWDKIVLAIYRDDWERNHQGSAARFLGRSEREG